MSLLPVLCSHSAAKETGKWDLQKSCKGKSRTKVSCVKC